MKIIIAGAGQVGSYLAEMFSQEYHDIIVIDKNENNIKSINEKYDILTINGSCTSFEVLNSSGINKSSLFIAVTESEETNLVAAMMAKKLGAEKTFARIDNPEYLSEQNREYFTNLGVDSIICPEKLAANEIINLIRQAGSSEIFEFSGGKLLLFVVKLESSAPIINKSLYEAAQIIKKNSFRAVAITRNEKTIIPRGNDVFQINDLVHVITTKDDIDALLKFSGKQNYKIDNIMILGGKRIGFKTARELEKHIKIKLIESDKERCDYLAEKLKKTLIINGDYSDVSLMLQENLSNMDAFIAVTNDTETNILSTLFAKKHGVKKTISEIENIDYIDLAENIGIDTIINKKLLVASYIFRHTMGSRVNSVKCLTGANAEVFEMIAKKDSLITSDQLNNLNFPKDAIIGGIIRDNQAIIATGETKVEPKDKVIVFSLPTAIHKVDEFFK
ncbi:MAG: Trk system potassium transporter TrkA [Marinilabiliales bacterium]